MDEHGTLMILYLVGVVNKIVAGDYPFFSWYIGRFCSKTAQYPVWEQTSSLDGLLITRHSLLTTKAVWCTIIASFDGERRKKVERVPLWRSGSHRGSNDPRPE
jgi:hypothetical protein